MACCYNSVSSLRQLAVCQRHFYCYKKQNNIIHQETTIASAAAADDDNNYYDDDDDDNDESALKGYIEKNTGRRQESLPAVVTCNGRQVCHLFSRKVMMKKKMKNRKKEEKKDEEGLHYIPI